MLSTHMSTEPHHTSTHIPHSPSLLHDEISDDDSEISISRSTSTSISHDMTSWKAIKKRQEQARMLSAAGRDYDMDDDDMDTPYPTTSNDSMRTSMSSYQTDTRTHATSTSTTTSKINIPTLQIPTSTTSSTPSPDVIDEVYAQLAQHLSITNPKFNKAQRIIQERRSIAMQQRQQPIQHTQSARYTHDTQKVKHDIQPIQHTPDTPKMKHDIQPTRHIQNDNEKDKHHDLREKTSIIHTGVIFHTSEQSSARSTSGIASHPISPVTESRGLYQPSNVVTGAISASQSLPSSTISSPILGPVTLGSRHVSSPALAIQSTHNPVSHIIAALDVTRTMTPRTARSMTPHTPTSDSRRLTTSMLQAMNTPPRQTTPITSIISSPMSLPISTPPRISPDETRKRSVLDRLLARTSPQHAHRKSHQRAASMSVSMTTSSVRLAKRRQWSAIGAMYEAEDSESSQRRGKSVELTKIENKHVDEDEDEVEETTEQRQARARMASIMGQAYDDVDSDDEKSSPTAPPVVPLPVTDIDSTVDAYAQRADERLRAITRHHVDVDDDISHDSKEIENSMLESDIRIQKLRAISAHGAAYEADASVIENDEDDESDTESRLEARASQRLRQRMPLLSRDGAEYSEGESSIRRMSTSHHGSCMTYVRHVDVMTPHHEQQQSISITPGRPYIEGQPISVDVDVHDEDESSPALQAGPNGDKPRVVMMHTSSTFVTRARTPSTPVSGANLSS